MSYRKRIVLFYRKSHRHNSTKNADLKTCIQYGLEKGFAFYHTPESLAELMYFQRLRDLNEFFSLPEDEIESDGYVLHALEAAIWCLLHTNRFRDCLLRAVNLGDDTDTVGAVTGALAGIIYGYDAIPAEWLKDLRRKTSLTNISSNDKRSITSFLYQSQIRSSYATK